MLIINTPFPNNMTSNTAPSPYVASASSVFNSEYIAWRAFSDTALNPTELYDCWASASGVRNAWVQIDLGKPTVINKYIVYARGRFITNVDKLAASPSTWTVQGSNDGVTFTTIDSQSGKTVAVWTETSGRLEFFLSGTYTYRYYRIHVTAVNGGNIVALGGFRLLLDEYAADSISWQPRAMTTNTAPAPFKISASSIHSSIYDAYVGVNSAILNTTIEPSYNLCWATSSGKTTGYIQIDMGYTAKVVKYRFAARGVGATGNTEGLMQSPNSWQLLGSHNGVDFDVIDTKSGITGAMWGETYHRLKVFELPEPVSYRYFRLNVLSVNGGSIITLRGFNLGIDLRDRTAEEYTRAKWLTPGLISNTQSIFPNTNYVASSVTQYSAATPPWQAFRLPLADITPVDVASVTGKSGYIQLAIGRYTPVRYYRIRIRGFVGGNTGILQVPPSSWTLSGSNDGINFTVLDTQTNITNWSLDEPWKYFTLPSTSFYNVYRLTISDNNGFNGTGIGGLEFGCDPTFSAFKNTTTGKSYTIVDGSLVELVDDTKETILANGIPSNTSVDIQQIPDFETLVGLPFDVVSYSEFEDVAPAVMIRHAEDAPRVATSEPLDTSNIKTLSKLTFSGTDTNHALSTDGGSTFLTFKDGAWVETNNPAEWMTTQVANALTQAQLSLLGLTNSLILKHSIGVNGLLSNVTVTGLEKDVKTFSRIESQSFNPTTKTYTCQVGAAGTYQLNYIDKA